MTASRTDQRRRYYLRGFAVGVLITSAVGFVLGVGLDGVIAAIRAGVVIA